MSESDDELWRRCGDDDASALGELYQRHARAIHAHAFRATGNWSYADDALSIVFLEAWRRRDAAVQQGMVLAWLYGVAVNVLRNERRARRRVARLAARVARAADHSHDLDEHDIAQRLDDEARAAELMPMLRSLPRRERDVVGICWWAGLTYEQAAVALDVPIGTVRSRLSRARARLERTAPDAFLTTTPPPVAAATDGDPR